MRSDGSFCGLQAAKFWRICDKPPVASILLKDFEEGARWLENDHAEKSGLMSATTTRGARTSPAAERRSPVHREGSSCPRVASERKQTDPADKQFVNASPAHTGASCIMP